MTSSAPAAATTAPRSNQPVSAATPRPAARVFMHYLGHSLLATLREWSFLAFIIAMPSTMYLFFAGIYGDQVSAGGATVAALMMLTMATYGALGAAMSAGNQIQTERATGWFRQLMITALTPTQFVAAKILVAAGVVIPAIATVFVAGLVMGVRMPLAVWLASGSLILISLLPMVVLGLVLGLWFKPAASSAATTLVMLALSMLGGLWFPLDMMPPAMQTIGRWLPSYWAGRIGSWPVTGGDFPVRGVVVIGIWTLALVGLGALGYRRAVRTARR